MILAYRINKRFLCIASTILLLLTVRIAYENSNQMCRNGDKTRYTREKNNNNTMFMIKISWLRTKSTPTFCQIVAVFWCTCTSNNLYTMCITIRQWPITIIINKYEEEEKTTNEHISQKEYARRKVKSLPGKKNSYETRRIWMNSHIHEGIASIEIEKQKKKTKNKVKRLHVIERSEKL